MYALTKCTKDLAPTYLAKILSVARNVRSVEQGPLFYPVHPPGLGLYFSRLKTVEQLTSYYLAFPAIALKTALTVTS